MTMPAAGEPGSLLERLQLRFSSPEAEDEFLRSYRARRGLGVQVALVLAAICFGLFGFLEYWVLGVTQSALPMFAFVAAAVASLAALPLGYVASLRDYRSWLALGAAVLGALAVISAVLLHSQPRAVIYTAELIVALLWIYGLPGLRVLTLAGIAWALTVAFILGLVFGDVSSTLLVIAAILLLCGNLVGSIIAYGIESLSRREYRQARRLDQEVERNGRWATALRDLAMELSTTHDLKLTFDKLLHHMHGILPYDAVALAVIQDRQLRPLMIQGALFELEELGDLFTAELINALNERRSALPSADELSEKTLFGRTTTRAQSYRLDVPVVYENRLLGIMSLARIKPAFDAFEVRVADSLMFHAMVAMRSARLYAQTKVLAVKRDEAQGQKVDADNPPSVPAQSRPPAVAEAAEVAPPQTGSRPAAVPASPVKPPTAQPSPQVAALRPAVPVVEDELAPKKPAEAPAPAPAPVQDEDLPIFSRAEATRLGEDRYRAAQHSGESLALCMVDVDGLAKIREKYGDKIANSLLEQIVEHVDANSREEDVVGRYGKDGFTVLLPRTTLQAAEDLAERVRTFVEMTSFNTQRGRMSVTLTVGLAAMTEREGDFAAMLRRADQAVYAVKKTGGNAVKVRI